MNQKFMNKKPIELNAEELLQLTNKITLITHQRNNNINYLQSSEDTAQEMLTYLYEKSAKGKTGMKELQEKCSMPHFINTLHFEARNSVNYIMRKKKTQRQLFNTDSLDMPVLFDSNGEPRENLVDNIPNQHDALQEVEDKLDLRAILSQIDNTENAAYTLQYNERTKSIFSYRRLTEIYFELFSGKRLTAKDFEGTIFNTETGIALTKEEINPILSGFKSYMKENQILGGIT